MPKQVMSDERLAELKRLNGGEITCLCGCVSFDGERYLCCDAHAVLGDGLTDEEKQRQRDMTEKRILRRQAKTGSFIDPDLFYGGKKVVESPLQHAADRAFRFLGGLDLRDHPVAVQREAVEVVRELGKALRPVQENAPKTLTLPSSSQKCERAWEIKQRSALPQEDAEVYKFVAQSTVTCRCGHVVGPGKPVYGHDLDSTVGVRFLPGFKDE